MGDPVLDLMKSGGGRSGGGSSDPVVNLMRGGGAGAASSDPVVSMMSGKAPPPTSLVGPDNSFLETGKTAVMNLVDLISRPNYAVAGAAEEAFSPKGGGLSAVPGRVISELLSGVGGLKGQKEGFGQVMEQAGVATGGSLSDLVPFMYSPTGEGIAFKKGGILDPTARGTGGLALDIATDPLTYLTFGAGKAIPVVMRSGTVHLSEKGAMVWADIQKAAKPALEQIVAIENPAFRTKALTRLSGDMRDVLQSKIMDDTGKIIAPELLDKGGAKFMGQTVISGETFDKLGHRFVSTLSAVPGGTKTINAAASFHDAVASSIHSIFSAFPKLADEAPQVRDAAIQIHRNAKSTQATISHQLYQEASAIQRDWDKALKADPDLGRKMYQLREKTGSVVLTEAQQSIYDRVVAMYDTMGQTAVKMGFLEPQQFRRDYFHHAYLNSPEEFAEVSKAAGRQNASTVAKFTHERPFSTYAEAEAVSKQMNAVGKEARSVGQVANLYPDLRPNYDVMNNLNSYIHQYADGAARKQWYDEGVRTFGKPIGALDLSAVRDLSTRASLDPFERVRIDGLFGKAKTVGKLVDVDNPAVWNDFAKASRLALGELSDDGKREYFRELMTRTKTPSQFAKVTLEYEEQFGKFFPRVTSVAAGDVEPALKHYGAGAAYVERSGGLWGEKPMMLPAAVVNDIENFTTTLMKNKQVGPGLRRALNGYDFLNNWFKTSVYTFWPASATRDLYNNVAQNYLDAGVGALARPLDTAKVLLGKGEVRLAGESWKASELSRLFDDVGITDKSGRSFIQMQGAAGQFKPTGKFAKVVAVRSEFDNMTRVQLALNMMHRGMDVRSAADEVRKAVFAYNELSPVEKSLFRRVIPFYTFSRKAIELHADALLHNPGRLANELKMFRGRDDENGMMTSFNAGSFKLRLNRDGETLQMLNGIDLPVNTVNALWRGSLKKTFMGDLGMLSPILKAPVEIATGTSLFTGQEMGRKNSPAVGRFIESYGPKPVQDWLGYSKEVDAAGRPKYTFDGQRFYIAFQTWIFSRAISSSDRAFREYLKPENERIGSAMLDLLTGLREQDMNLTEEQAKLAAERQHMLEEAGYRSGQLKRFERYYAPKGQR